MVDSGMWWCRHSAHLTCLIGAALCGAVSRIVSDRGVECSPVPIRFLGSDDPFRAVTPFRGDALNPAMNIQPEGLLGLVPGPS
jgi:hypothetical protein